MSQPQHGYPGGPSYVPPSFASIAPLLRHCCLIHDRDVLSRATKDIAQVELWLTLKNPQVPPDPRKSIAIQCSIQLGEGLRRSIV
jgi:hypothetical protein